MWDFFLQFYNQILQKAQGIDPGTRAPSALPTELLYCETQQYINFYIIRFPIPIKLLWRNI